ncbi:biotin synthase BioB [Desulforhopalus singaporensis]|uniref:Biotin synthase n=1 Tax=Desulforhopalus singaporensis TaxID=91360 RepID=A0A1H0VDZ7_9BACT|nr:biotin synthase BioB [Desulforhopalus singaporensis]SDP76670.1 biotin synthase [Desulforhopalus singaporensis]
MLMTLVQRIRNGSGLNFDEALQLAHSDNPRQLYQAADELRKTFHNEEIDLCSIVNARSGRCSENCKFCAQSSWYPVDIDTYEIIDEATALQAARENEAAGVTRFSLVAAGRSVSEQHIEQFGKIYEKIAAETDMSLCASMGFLTPHKAEMLKAIGVKRYHCNLETSRSFFANVCTTHTWEEKVKTIETAREAGLEVCSGGIIGMGETLKQRLELAFELQALNIRSIPLNILTPIANTPYGGIKPIGVSEVLTSIAMFRFINPEAIIRLAGGRNMLGNKQSACFTSGANGAIVGNYLTTAGNNLEQDIAMFRSLGYAIASSGGAK